MKDEKTDEEIIALYKNGNIEAFKNLIDRYLTPIYNFAARATNQSDAPDIVQEIFIKIWKHIKRFKPKKASFKTWLFTVARNTITDFLRKKKSVSFSDMDSRDSNIYSFAENIPDEKPLSDQSLQKLQDRELLNKILKKLPLVERKILKLHYQENMTFKKIGAVLKKPLHTVKSIHRRLLAKLRKWIKSLRLHLFK